jgi:hypothetical protein
MMCVAHCGFVGTLSAHALHSAADSVPPKAWSAVGHSGWLVWVSSTGPELQSQPRVAVVRLGAIVNVALLWGQQTVDSCCLVQTHARRVTS